MIDKIKQNKITETKWFPETNKNLFPHEYFTILLFFHNYIIHSELITSYEQIENDNFREYLKQLPNIFKNDKCLLFKNSLPIEYFDKLENKVFFRPNKDGYVKILEKKSPNISMEKYLGMNIIKEMKGKRYDNERFCNYVMETPLNKIFEDNIFPTYCEKLKILYDNKAIIPCVSFENFENEYKKYNLSLGDTQLTYGEYINYRNSEKETRPITICLEKKRAKPKLSINEKCCMYWVDIHQLHFKHYYVLNSGVIDTDSDDSYTVLNNSIELSKDNDFFINLMSSVHGTKVKDQVINNPNMCPVEVFLIDGILYSHDHKRLTACLLSGVKYILASINQGFEKIKSRSVGYHYQRCVFSKSDSSLMLRLTEYEMKEKYGHYFFIVGTNDSTTLLKSVMSNSIKDRFYEINKTVKLYTLLSRLSDKIEKCSEYSNNLLTNYISTYDNKEITSPYELYSHYGCIPNIFDSLTNNKVREDYKESINSLFLALNNRLSKKTKYLTYIDKINKYNNIDESKYLKYLTKLELLNNNETYNMVGGGGYEQLITKYRLNFVNKKNINILNCFWVDFNTYISNKDIKNLINCDLYEKLCLTYVEEFEKFFNTINYKKSKYCISILDIFKNIAKMTDDFYYDDNIVKLFSENTYINSGKSKRDSEPILTEKIKSESKKMIDEEVTDKQNNLKNIIEKIKYVKDNFASFSNIDLVKWELTNISLGIGNKDNIDIKHNIINYILEEPTINKMSKLILQIKYQSIYRVNTRKNRYNKTNDGILEDLVLLFRIAYDAELWHIKTLRMADYKDKKADQLYSLEDLILWQKYIYKENKKPEIKSKFPYLKPELFNFDTDSLNSIINKQKKDHIRIFKTDDNLYGAYQGLQNKILYSYMMPYNFYIYGKYTLHTTEINIANSILSGSSEKGPSIEPSERYTHGFTNISYNTDTESFMLNNNWKFKLRLMARFFTRFGLVIDMEKLFDFYKTINIDWFNVCSVNDIGTIIFYQRIPPHAIITKNRVVEYIPVSIEPEFLDKINYDDIIQQKKLDKNIYNMMILNTRIVSPGEPYNILDIMNIYNLNEVLEQFNYEYYLLNN